MNDIREVLNSIMKQKIPIHLDEQKNGYVRIMRQKDAYRATIIKVADDFFEVRIEPDDRSSPPHTVIFVTAFLSAIDGRIFRDKPL